MNSTILAVAESLLGILAFSVFLLPPGFLLAHLANLNGFRLRSRPEQTLWSVALGIPVAVTLSDLLGRLLPPTSVLLCFVALALAAIAVALSASRRPSSPHNASPPGRALRWALVLAAALALYPSLALTDLQVGHRLFISTVMSDWSIRVPIINAAMHGTVPPLNPLSDLHGLASPLRYYYFWYVLCARVAQLAHITGRSALTASCTWAAYGLLSVLFLSLKYLLGIRENLRVQCLLGALLASILGLDIIPVTLQLMNTHLQPTLEMEWWRDDRTPSFLGTILYAPHHIGGMVCCLVAFLLLSTLADIRPSAPRAGLFMFVAGICFAATVGTSTYVAFIFVIVCLVWAVDLLRQRRWHMIPILAGSGLVAFLLSHPFLHELKSGSSAVGGAFVKLGWRSQNFVLVHLAHRHLEGHLGLKGFVLVQSLVLLLDFLELGFFFLVVLHRLRLDLRRPSRLSSGNRAIWALFVGIALPTFFLSSATVTDSSSNDLGMHAGILLRFVLLVFATPWIYSLWKRRSELPSASPSRKLLLAGVAATMLLGVSAQLYQILAERLYFPAMESRIVNRRIRSLTKDRLSYRLFNIRANSAALDRLLPRDAVIQFNPSGLLQPAFALDSNRQIAAFDDGCGTAFGGDYAACQPVFRGLRVFYGLAPVGVLGNSVPFDQQGVVDIPPELAQTVAHDADFAAVCSSLRLNAILVESTDPIWNQSGSWVWTRTPVVQTDTTRSFLCPTPPTR